MNCLNVLKGNVSLTPHQLRALRPYKNHLRDLVCKKVSIKRKIKKKIILQKISFVGALLRPLTKQLLSKMIMIDPRRVAMGMQDTFRLRTEEPDVASMRRLDQAMDDILNSHDSPADVTKYHQALTKHLLFDRKVGQHETIKITSPSVEPVIRETPVEQPVESPVESPVEPSTHRSQSVEPPPPHRSESRRSHSARPKRKRAPKNVYSGNWSNY